MSLRKWLVPVKPGESSSEISHHDTEEADTDSEADIVSTIIATYVPEYHFYCIVYSSLI